jgi:hypothetical protein
MPEVRSARSERRDATLANTLGIAAVAQPIPFLPIVSVGWVAVLPVLWRDLPARARRVALLVVLSAFSTLVSDYLVHTPRTATLKAAAQVIAFAVFFVAYSSLGVRLRPQSLVNAVGFLGAGWLVAALIFAPHVPGYGEWKYYVASPFGLIVAVFATKAWYRRRRLLAHLLLLATAGLMGVTGFRSYATEFLVTSLVVAAAVRSRARRTWSARRVAWSIVAVVGASFLFSFAANAGTFGAGTRTKWRLEGGNPVAVLTTARPETAVSVGLIPRHLIRGVGSEGRISADDFGIVVARAGLERPAERAALVDRLTRGGLDVHSVVFQRWIQGGALAAAAFFVILWFCGVRLGRLTGRDLDEWGPLMVFMAVALAWDFLFSPWTYFVGPVWAVYAALVLARPEA